MIRSEHVGCKGQVEIFPEFTEGLQDLECFSHIYLIFHFNQAGPMQLIVEPFLQDVKRGALSARVPCCPNGIGLSLVGFIGQEGNILYLHCVDILDGTLLLDIKPYTARFDRLETSRNGWQDEVDEATAQNQGRREYKGGDSPESA